MKAACAGGEGVRVFSLGGKNGGSLEDPELLYHVVEPGVTIGHSAAWSWDGKVLIFGHEPGGGVAPECEATDPALNYTYFFYDGDTGAKVGSWTLPRPQSATENCTLHNLNTIPLKSGRDVARARQLPVGDERGRLHLSGQPGRAGVVRPAPDRPDGHRRSVVVVLVQRLHLRDEHHRGPEHLRVHGPPVKGNFTLNT